MKGIALALALMTFAVNAQTQVSKQLFGKTADGTPIDIYTVKSGSLEARITNFGGIVVSLKVPDRKGKSADVVLGYDSLDGYLTNPAYLGALIGRYGNRIAGGKFTLDGKTYTIPQNDGTNALHGGTKGFNKAVWSAKEIPDGIELSYTSPDGDQGFPGNLSATVRYTLHDKDLKIEYSATTDKDTVLNLTNHSYFNLAGQGNGDILKDQLKINASRYTPVDANLIPSGELAPVEGTPFDFRKLTTVGGRINDNNEQLKLGKGYDHNFVLDSGGGKLAELPRLLVRLPRIERPPGDVHVGGWAAIGQRLAIESELMLPAPHGRVACSHGNQTFAGCVIHEGVRFLCAHGLRHQVARLIQHPFQGEGIDCQQTVERVEQSGGVGGRPAVGVSIEPVGESKLFQDGDERDIKRISQPRQCRQRR